MSSWKLLENCKGELTVTVEGEKWAAAQKKAFNKIVKNLDMPGFRKGKVPAGIARKYISEGHILQEALSDAILNDALQAGVEEHSLVLIDSPNLKEVTDIDTDKVTFVIECTVEPEVTLGEYTNLGIEKDAVLVEDAEVEAELTKLQQRNVQLELKDEDAAVEEGDTAVIDFEGFVDGVAFDGGKGENYPLEIGSGQFIPGFEEQVVGMKAEETKDINVTFPENYAEELASKDAVFKVTVHEIKAKVLPEIDDELITDAEIEGVETVEQFKAYMLEQLTKSKEEAVEGKYENDCIAKAIENATFEIPAVMVESEVDQMVQEFQNNLMQNGLALEQYYQMFNSDEEQIKDQMRPEAEVRVSQRLVLAAVAKKEAIEATEEDINAEYEELAAQYGMEAEKIKPIIPAEVISENIKLRKAAELVKA